MAKSSSQSQLMSDADSWVNYRRWKKVSSSNVLAIHYDKKDKILSVQFKGSAKGVKFPIYTYSPVVDTLAKSMYLAGSKGKFVWSVLRNGSFTVSGPM
jgi:hypothetical protein